MCGIFGYIGKRNNATEIVLGGLKNLEYRGYDSWGIVVQEDGFLYVEKNIGKISEVEQVLESHTNVSLAMGHSRWATHGGVTQCNAHPHVSMDSKLALIHNGIIENYLELKNELISEGFRFLSDTDSEVIVNLLEFYSRSHDFQDALYFTLERLQGRYAICVIHQDMNMIVGARRGSPLIVGLGEDEIFLASDVPAFLEYTRVVNYIDDDQIVFIQNNTVQYFNISTREEVKKRDVIITWDVEDAQKGEHEHFMIKEIMEQKETIQRAINQSSEEIQIVTDAIKNAYGTYLVGCGTAGKVGLAATYAFSSIAHRHVNFAFGSEFEHLEHFIRPGSLMIAISQSGETADTLEAIHIAQQKGAKVLSILNVEGSTMARESDHTLYIKTGPEKSVASTKATTAQLALLILIAYSSAGKLDEGKRLLVETSGKINDMLNPRYEDHIRAIAEKIHHVESLYVIGKAMNYAMALESAIKLQEVSYIHAEGFAAGELKHGPLALISEGTPLIVLVSNDETKQAVLSNAMEVKSRGGYIIGVSPDPHEIFDEWIKVPDCGPASAIANIIPIQIMAYHLALLKNNNPDKPRNLAKSVTVK